MSFGCTSQSSKWKVITLLYIMILGHRSCMALTDNLLSTLKNSVSRCYYLPGILQRKLQERGLSVFSVLLRFSASSMEEHFTTLLWIPSNDCHAKICPFISSFCCCCRSSDSFLAWNSSTQISIILLDEAHLHLPIHLLLHTGIWKHAHLISK